MTRLLLPRFLVPAALFAAATVACGAAEPPPKDNPFLPSGSGAAAAPAATKAETYQLSGYVAVDKGGMLGVTRLSDKRSVWVPLGGTTNEITALSYDPANDQAVIRVDGQLLNISLRKGVVVPGRNLPPVVASATPPAQPATGPATPVPMPVLAPEPPLPAPGTPAFQEREARMLVTDLLEIGLEQRKAYQEAQRQAAAQGARAPRAEAATPPR